MRQGSASLSAKVNQQCYFAKLLLAEQAVLEADDAKSRALNQALEQSAVSAMFLAYQGFVQEVAQSCQVLQPVDSVQQLDELLQQEQRSHAVVHNLLELVNSNSWLSQLIERFDKRLQTAPQPKPKAGLIAMSGQADLPSLLLQLQDFIAQQREFLQEW